jgi:membrane protein
VAQHSDLTTLPDASWSGAIKRTVREFQADNLTDWAATLTYYGVLSIFPALLVLAAILGLIGRSATEPLLENVETFSPGAATDILRAALETLQKGQGAAGFAFVVGIAAALWSASSYIAAFMRAANVIWDVEEGRPLWKRLPLRLGVTVLMLVLLAVTALMVLITGPLAERAGDLLGVGHTTVSVWDLAKWPVLVVLVALMFALLYHVAPNVQHPSFRWLTPGAILGVIVWIAASAAFAAYVATFGSYNKTYGAIASVIVLLVWLWISNVALLLGAELNAELERGHRIEAGHPPHKEPFLPPKDEPQSR